ncbi:hypothetical protein OEZ86_002142 [Tetradesmus obliquus]|nr:hypothetical protein OEZ86_002142 [Tetradesmus obliquus]
MPQSPLRVSPAVFPSSPVMLAERAHTAGLEDAQKITESDDFFMFTFKISPCVKRTLHEWNSCGYAHAGEKAARRDPRLFAYNSVACPEMLQSGKCPRGDTCDMAHSVFEYWLHPQRYRTTLCRDGAACSRSVCFFAHSQAQLRPLTAPADAAAADPLSCKGKFSLSGLPAAAQRRRSQDVSRAGAARQSPQARGPTPQGSGITQQQQQQQQRMVLLGSGNNNINNGGGSSSSSLDSMSPPLGHASLASYNSMGSSSCVSPVMPLQVLLPGSSSLAAAAAPAGQPGMGRLNDLIAAFQAQAISSHQQALAKAAAAADDVNIHLQALWASLGMPGDGGCLPVSNDSGCGQFASAACSSPVGQFMGVAAGAGPLPGSPQMCLTSALSLPQSYTAAYSPSACLGLQLQQQQQQQQQQMLMSCGSLGTASSLGSCMNHGCMNSGESLLLPPGSLQQPVLMAALSADAAFMNMAGVPANAAAAAQQQVSPRVPGGYMQFAGQPAGLAW